MAGAGRAVKRVDRRVLLGVEHEAEQVEVLLLPIRVHRLGDDDRAVLDVPAQNDLRGSDAMGLRDAFDGAISGVQIGAAGHRGIRLDRDAMRLAIRHDLTLLPGRMQLDLVDGRVLAGLLVQALEMLGKEVAHAERLHTALRAELLERLPGLPGTPVERRRPMQHVHVHVIELQQFELTVERLAGRIVPLLGIAQLRGDPQVLAVLPLGEARGLERAADAGLVVVSGGAVDMPVSGSQGAFHNGSDAFVIDTQHAKADLRNQMTVAQRNHRSMESCHETRPFVSINHYCCPSMLYADAHISAPFATPYPFA